MAHMAGVSLPISSRSSGATLPTLLGTSSSSPSSSRASAAQLGLASQQQQQRFDAAISSFDGYQHVTVKNTFVEVRSDDDALSMLDGAKTTGSQSCRARFGDSPSFANSPARSTDVSQQLPGDDIVAMTSSDAMTMRAVAMTSSDAMTISSGDESDLGNVVSSSGQHEQQQQQQRQQKAKSQTKSRQSASSPQSCNIRVQVRAGVEQSPSTPSQGPTPTIVAVESLQTFLDNSGRTCLDLRVILDQPVTTALLAPSSAGTTQRAAPQQIDQANSSVGMTASSAGTTLRAAPQQIDQANSSVGMSTSGARRARVCRHWEQGGWCAYESSCKFLHPEHRRGGGASNSTSVAPPPHISSSSAFSDVSPSSLPGTSLPVRRRQREIAARRDNTSATASAAAMTEVVNNTSTPPPQPPTLCLARAVPQ